MRKCFVQVFMCCLLLMSVFVCVIDGEEKQSSQPAPKTAKDYWDDYRDANQNAMAASINYNTQVDAADDVSENLAANKKTVSDSTKTTLQNLFIAGGLYVLGAPTVFIPALGQIKPTLDMVNAWLNDGELEKLKVVAEQATSDAHRESVKYDTDRDKAYNDYTTKYESENPNSDPKPPLVDVKHKVYNFVCHGGCGESWDNVEAARLTHQKTCAGGSATVPGCGKSYYACTDTTHEIQTCTNFIGYTCGVQFRECANGQCSPSGSLRSLAQRHSASGSVKPDESLRKGTNICPECKKPHSTSGSGSGS
ncbi:MAG: hypothetical protein OXN25_03825 [Candidatus Poribacteria bacterium]|nr:hypothetical protein [Candidatus Poribacteria bacterium]